MVTGLSVRQHIDLRSGLIFERHRDGTVTLRLGWRAGGIRLTADEWAAACEAVRIEREQA